MNIEKEILKNGFIEYKGNKNDIDFKKEILRLKQQKSIVILGHFYQIPDIQDLSDYVGDSLVLAQQAVKADADIIVFAGVHFMAETAKILNPTKKVVIPDMNAGCSLAESAPADKFRKFKEKYPGHIVVSYINCTAEIKALSDIICTSSNAVDIVNSIPENQPIIFAPDRNLGAYVQEQTNREMVIWDGACEVHDILKVEKTIELKQKHPDAKLIAHPECQQPILEIADFVGSTSKLLKFSKNDPAQKFIVATETGILYQMKKDSPGKTFIIVPNEETCNCNDCPYMKLNTLEKLYTCIKYEQPEIVLSKELINRAKEPLTRMLEVSAKIKG